MKDIIKVGKRCLPVRDFLNCSHIQSLITAIKTLYVSSKTIPLALYLINSALLTFSPLKQTNNNYSSKRNLHNKYRFFSN